MGKRGGKIEIKNNKKKKKALNQVDGTSPELLTASERRGKKKRRKWTPGHIVRLNVYLVCVPYKGQVLDMNYGLGKETLFPTKMEPQSASSGKGIYSGK